MWFGGVIVTRSFGNSDARFDEYARVEQYALTIILCLALLLLLSTSRFRCWAATSGPSQDASSWTLSTDDTVLTVSVKDDWPILRSLRSKVGDDNWLQGPLKENLMEAVQIDGTMVKTDWKFQGADLDAKKEQLTLRFANADPQLELNSIWRGRPGPGPVEHWLTIVNDSGKTVTVTRQDSLVLDGLTPAANQSADVWWINRGGSNASLEGGTFVAKADADLDQVLKSDVMDGSSPVPWLAVQVGTLKGLYVGWEFSGIGRIHAKTVSTNPTRLSVEVGNLPEFKTDLYAGNVSSSTCFCRVLSRRH